MSSAEKIKPVEIAFTEKQKYIKSQLEDLGNKEARLMFQLDQIKASQQVFNHAFIEASKEATTGEE